MRKFMLLTLLISITLIGCNKPDYLIDADDTLELMENSNAILIDVRTPSEFNEGHIENAILIPLSVLEDSIVSVIPDKDTTIIVYCRSGNRSADAIDILVNLGYENIYDLGGIIYWPYDIVT